MTPYAHPRLTPHLRGEFIGNGIANLAKKLDEDGALVEYLEWCKHPWSRLLLEALEEMARQAPPMIQPADQIPVQYGITIGLQIASALLTDPTILKRQMEKLGLDNKELPPTLVQSLSRPPAAAPVAAGEPEQIQKPVRRSPK